MEINHPTQSTKALESDQPLRSLVLSGHDTSVKCPSALKFPTQQIQKVGYKDTYLFACVCIIRAISSP